MKVITVEIVFNVLLQCTMFQCIYQFHHRACYLLQVYGFSYFHMLLQM